MVQRTKRLKQCFSVRLEKYYTLSEVPRHLRKSGARRPHSSRRSRHPSPTARTSAYLYGTGELARTSSPCRSTGSCGGRPHGPGLLGQQRPRQQTTVTATQVRTPRAQPAPLSRRCPAGGTLPVRAALRHAGGTPPRGAPQHAAGAGCHAGAHTRHGHPDQGGSSCPRRRPPSRRTRPTSLCGRQPPSNDLSRLWRASRGHGTRGHGDTRHG